MDDKLELIWPEKEVLITLPPLKIGKKVYRNLVHFFRQPNAEDKKIYIENLTDEKLSALARTIQANITLYDRCALRIEGYIVPEGMDWKAALWPEHKSMAATRLLERYGVFTGEMQKN